MAKKCNSITCVFNGDWNALFMQPDWIAQNVFMNETLDVTVNGFGRHISILFKNRNVVLHPTQSQVIFTLLEDFSTESFSYFCNCITGFLQKAYTTTLTSFGFNMDFEDNSDVFASIIDNMNDNIGLVENECEIVSTKIEKAVKYNNSIFNVETSIDNTTGVTRIHINEHHEGPFTKDSLPSFEPNDINDFMSNCWIILNAIGYEKEDQ